MLKQRLDKIPLNNRWLEVIILALVLLLAGYLRLANLTDNPGWFSDEGSNLDVAYHLQHGELQYMALGQSTLMVSRLVLFESLLAASLTVWGGGIYTLRTLTAVLGLISVLTLYAVARRLTGKPLLALLSALLLAIYPQAVLYSRFGFSYNLLPPLILIALLGLWEYIQTDQRSWLLLATVMIGLGTISDIWMLTLIPLLAIVVLARRWRDLLWSLPIVVLAFSLYCLFLWSRAPQAFGVDLQFVLFRVSNVPLLGQAQNVALNYTVLLSQDFWMPCAVIGFLLLRPLKLRTLMIFLFFGCLIILGRTVALYNLSAHYMIPLLPFVAFGAAVLIYTGTPYLWRQIHEALPHSVANWEGVMSAGVCLFIAGAPFLVTLSLDMQHVQTGFPTAIDPFLTNPTEAKQVADFINAHAHASDLVIVNPSISWLLNTHTADIQMSIAATGQGTVHYPPNIQPERWAFDPRIDQARYVVIDNFWRTWGEVNIVGLTAVIEQIQRWPHVFQAGSLSVYQNPAIGELLHPRASLSYQCCS